MDTKSKQLGMPFGTANHRLRKQLLFRYVVRCGDNFCYKCTLEITTIEDFSIEHKKPWQGISNDLFWDLDNIAYSHLKCNVRAYPFPDGRPHGTKNKYDVENCRCTLCREARMKYQREKRSR